MIHKKINSIYIQLIASHLYGWLAIKDFNQEKKFDC